MAEDDNRTSASAAGGSEVGEPNPVGGDVSAFLIEFLHLDPRSDPANSLAAWVDADAVGVAVVSPGGRTRRACPRFVTLIGDPEQSIACRELALRAAGRGRAIGHVETETQGVLAVLAVAGGEALAWPLAVERVGQGFAADSVVLVVFAPSRSRELIRRSADALGLSSLEARLAGALLFEPSLEAAARSLGVSRETAKDALARALRKAGAKRSSQLVGRLIDLSSNRGDAAPGFPASCAIGLSPVETRVAEHLARGATAQAAATALGLSLETVKSYRRSVFGKLGVHRSRDLRRLMTETAELQHLALAGEVSAIVGESGEPRLFVDVEGRPVAALDYGPRTGRPVLLMHGYSTGRLAPPPLLAALSARGYRVIIPQRPGFGLTAPAVGDYVETAAGDAAGLLERLGIDRAGVIARDGGVACALALGARLPEAIGPALLLNPRHPRYVARPRSAIMASIGVMFLRHPALIEPFTSLMIRHMNREWMTSFLRRGLSPIEADRLCFDEPGVADHLIADLRGLVGRSPAGFMAEHRLFSDGWRPAHGGNGPRWTLVFSGEIFPSPDLDAWRSVAAGPPTILAGAGQLAQFTHAANLAEIFDRA